MTDAVSPNPSLLRDVVAERLELHWPSFAQDHPHLAAAIEPIRLTDVVVGRLADDPAYRAAMDAAGHDERVLAAAAKIAGLIDTQIRRVLGL